MEEVVSFQDFQKLDIRVVKVLEANRIHGKNRIIKLIIDIGSGEKRTIVAGGGQFYSPKDFLDKKFVAVVNLAPKKIASIESRGMLLAATSGKKPIWLTMNSDAPVGSKII